MLPSRVEGLHEHLADIPPHPLVEYVAKKLSELFRTHGTVGDQAALLQSTREQEVCQLRWEWEVAVPELWTSLFVLPEWLTKNGEERVVLLNRIAKEVVTAQRGIHATHVFAFRGREVGGP